LEIKKIYLLILRILATEEALFDALGVVDGVEIISVFSATNSSISFLTSATDK